MIHHYKIFVRTLKISLTDCSSSLCSFDWNNEQIYVQFSSLRTLLEIKQWQFLLFSLLFNFMDFGVKWSEKCKYTLYKINKAKSWLYVTCVVSLIKLLCRISWQNCNHGKAHGRQKVEVDLVNQNLYITLLVCRLKQITFWKREKKFTISREWRRSTFWKEYSYYIESWKSEIVIVVYRRQRKQMQAWNITKLVSFIFTEK